MKTILVACSRASVRLGVKHSLEEHWKYEGVCDRAIVLASELPDLIPFIQYRRLDLILLDVRLAKIEDGRSKVISKIRVSDYNANAPIVLLVPRDTAEHSRKTLLGYGADDVVFVEPVMDTDALRAVTQKFLDPAATWEASLSPEELMILKKIEKELPPEEAKSLKVAAAVFTGALDQARTDGKISYGSITGALGDMRRTALNPAATRVMFRLGGHDLDTLRHSLRVMGFFHSFKKA